MSSTDLVISVSATLRQGTVERLGVGCTWFLYEQWGMQGPQFLLQPSTAGTDCEWPKEKHIIAFRK